VELIHKPRQDNVVPNALSKKKKIQLEKNSTKTHALKAIFHDKNNLEWKIKEAYM
jgi:hypothetical protein